VVKRNRPLSRSAGATSCLYQPSWHMDSSSHYTSKSCAFVYVLSFHTLSKDKGNTTIIVTRWDSAFETKLLRVDYTFKCMCPAHRTSWGVTIVYKFPSDVAESLPNASGIRASARNLVCGHLQLKPGPCNGHCLMHNNMLALKTRSLKLQ
jgi:hypothetical protein